MVRTGKRSCGASPTWSLRPAPKEPGGAGGPGDRDRQVRVERPGQSLRDGLAGRRRTQPLSRGPPDHGPARGKPARTWRWCRRKPLLAGLGASLILAIVLGFGGIAWNWREAVSQKLEAQRQKALLEIAEQKARAQADKADAINRFFIDKLLLQAAPEHNPGGRGISLREAIDRAAGEVKSSFQDQPRVEAAVRLALGQTYHELGEYPTSELQLRGALAVLQSQKDDSGREQLVVMTELGHILHHLQRMADGEALLLRVVEQCPLEQANGDDLSLLSARYLAEIYKDSGHITRAEALVRRVLDRALASRGPRHVESLNAMNELSLVLSKQKRYDEAETILRECLRLKREVLGVEHPDTLSTQVSLANLIGQLGRLDEAENLLRDCLERREKVLGPDHPYTLYAYQYLARVLQSMGRLDEAESLLEAALERQRRVLGPQHRDTLVTVKGLDAVKKRVTQRSQRPGPDRTDTVL